MMKLHKYTKAQDEHTIYTIKSNVNMEEEDKQGLVELATIGNLTYVSIPTDITPTVHSKITDFGIVNELSEEVKEQIIEQSRNIQLELKSSSQYEVLKKYGLLTQKELKNAVDIKRNELISVGVPFSFSDGNGTVQTRDITDHRNIQANGTTALSLVVEGNGDTLMSFRDKEDVVHNIPASEMKDMCKYVMHVLNEIYKKSWSHKDLIKSKSFSELSNYDVNINW